MKHNSTDRGPDRQLQRFAPRLNRIFPIVGVVAMVLSGCSAESGSIVTFQPTGPGGEAAAISGTLVLENGCIALANPDGDSPMILAFPEGQADWDGETLTVGDQQLHLDEEAEFGGAEVGEGVTLPGFQAPEQCTSNRIWAVNLF